MDQGVLTDWLYALQVAATAASITAQVGTCHFISLLLILTQALVALSVHVGFCVRAIFGWIALFCCVKSTRCMLGVGRSLYSEHGWLSS